MPATVNADLFRIAFNFASTEATRYYLNGVLIQKHQAEGVYLVATDGHRMMVIHDATGSTTLDNVIVKLDKAALAACKPNRKDQAERLLRVEGDGVAHVLEAYGDEMRPTAMCHGAIIDGTFPDWTRVARPNLDEKAPAHWRHMANTKAAAAQAATNRNRPAGPNKVIVAAAPTGPTAAPAE